MVSVIQKFVVFRFMFTIFIAAFGWQPLWYKQSQALTQKFPQKVSLFLQKDMKSTMFV